MIRDWPSHGRPVFGVQKMIGVLTNFFGVIVGTAIGCLINAEIQQKYEDVLYAILGLIALGIGMESIAANMPKSHYQVLFIVSLAVGGLLGTYWDLDGWFNGLTKLLGGGKKGLSQGLMTAILLNCIGALSIVGAVIAAVKGNNTMLFTNALMALVTVMVLGASFGWGIMWTAPVILIWQGGIYLIAKYLSASFFSSELVTEISIVGGFLIAATGLSMMKVKNLKTLNLLPSLLIPIIFFIIKDLI